MDKRHAQIMANDLMRACGLRGWAFKFDSAKRRFGLCSHRNRTISLSGYMTELADRAMVKEVLLHEIAHALVGAGNGHNSVWRNKYMELGGNGQRLIDTTELFDKAVAKARYRIICDDHGETLGMAHRSNYRTANKFCRQHKSTVSLVANY